MTRSLIAAAFGGLCVFGFEPFAYHLLVPASVLGLVCLWSGATPGRAARYGFLFGCGLFGGGISWVYVSLHVYGHMPPAMAGLAVALLVAYLSLYPALVGWFQARYFQAHSAARLLLAIPGLWVFSEWLRSWIITGFPWLSLGYGQVDTALAGYAPVLGVYGISLVVVLCSSAAAWLLMRRSRVTAVVFVSVTGLLWGGGRLLQDIDWAQPEGPPLRVALVQGNVGLDRKWSPDSRGPILNAYLELSASQDQADLVVWPESALPMHLDELTPWLFERLASMPGDYVIGVLERQRSAAGGLTYNSVVATGSRVELYRKEHLVPFGEFLPLRGLLDWVLDYLRIPMADFSSWTEPQAPLNVAGTKVGVSICYEDAFPEQVRRALPAARLLLNVSEDAWFGDSLAPHQRLQMARMRALEAARPMLRAANTGVSAIIDHRGLVTAASPQFERLVLTGTTQPMRGATFYVRTGDAAIVLIALGLLFGAIAGSHKKHGSQSE